MNRIQTILKDHYDLININVSPQQGGWAALAYKVYNNNAAYFLKVYEKSRSSTPKWTELIDDYVPVLIWLMHNSKWRGKIPVPLLTKSGAYKCEDDEGIYLLYQYIDGETIGSNNLTDDQVCQLSQIIAELHLHGDEIPVVSDAVKEDFHVPFLQQLMDTLGKDFDHVPNDIREVLNPHMKQINRLVDIVDQLSVNLKNHNLRLSLCHTDIHNWNLMQSGQQLILIDWEGLKLAPVEADLMFLVDQPYYDDFLKIYQKVHSNFEINPDALHFYQARRKLEDIWEFIEQLLFDKQTVLERTATLNSLTHEVEDISE